MIDDKHDKDFMQEKWGVNNCDDVEEILPCPFCGNDDTKNICMDKLWRIFCDECFASGPRELTEVEAIASWNNCKR